jgi:hypothetical protein
MRIVRLACNIARKNAQARRLSSTCGLTHNARTLYERRIRNTPAEEAATMTQLRASHAVASHACMAADDIPAAVMGMGTGMNAAVVFKTWQSRINRPRVGLTYKTSNSL